MNELLLIQTTLDTYREEFLGGLKAESEIPVTVMSGTQHFVPSVRTRVTYPYLPLKNHYFIGRKFLWQQGVIKKSLAFSHVVIELNPRIVSTWVLIGLRRILGKKTICWGHANSRSHTGKTTGRTLMRRLAKGPTIAYTATDAEKFRIDYPGNQTFVAANALHKRSQIVAIRTSPGNDIIFSGRFHESKRPLEVLKAFHAVCLRSHRVGNLVMLGDGPLLNEIEAYVKIHNLESRVLLPGWVSSLDDLKTHYEHARVSVVAGYVGLNATQSLGFGVPMIYPERTTLRHAPEVTVLASHNSASYQEEVPGSLEIVLESVFEGEVTFASPMEISSEIAANYAIENMVDGFLSAVRMR